MFKTGDKIYTLDNIFINDGRKAFDADKQYTVFNISLLDGEDELVLINELGMLHSLEEMHYLFYILH